MQVEPLRSDLRKYLLRHSLIRKFEKQIDIFRENEHHPSLRTEALRPKQLKIYSFRIDRQYLAIFIILATRVAEIVDINNHYR